MQQSLDDRIRAHVLTHGGSAQRAQAASHVNADPAPASCLVRRLLDLWSWGVLSASVVQSLAETAEVDGLKHADVLKLSKIG